MSFAFKTPPAKPAFGEFREPLDAGEYILKKKGLINYFNLKNTFFVEPSSNI